MPNFMFLMLRNYQVKYEIFPIEKCSCPASNTCGHIIAAILSIAFVSLTNQKKNSNTANEKTTRAQCDNRSRIKKPYQKDVDCEYNSK